MENGMVAMQNVYFIKKSANTCENESGLHQEVNWFRSKSCGCPGLGSMSWEHWQQFVVVHYLCLTIYGLCRRPVFWPMVIECVYLFVNQTRALKHNEHLVMTKIQMYWTWKKLSKKGPIYKVCRLFKILGVFHWFHLGENSLKKAKEQIKICWVQINSERPRLKSWLTWSCCYFPDSIWQVVFSSSSLV